MSTKIVRRYKYKNIAVAMAVVLLIILSIATACSDNSSSKDKKPGSSSVADNSSSSQADKNKLTDNFRYISIKNEDAVGKGVLTLINSQNKYKGGTPSGLTGVYEYLFNKNNDQIMSASSTEVKGEKALLESFNSLMSDFYSETKLTNVIINTIYYSDKNSDSSVLDEEASQVAAPDSQEHETGYAFDLNTYTADTGSYPDFTGTGKYKWITDNCYKYGIIQRYTQEKAAITGVKAQSNHFRYVGKPNAEIMAKNNLCLEEYLEYIKDYSFENPLTFESEDKITYSVYYVSADKGKTTNLPIPLKEDDSEYKYEYSGNNMDGYIIWVVTEDNSDLLKADSSSISDSSNSSLSKSDNSETDSSSIDESPADISSDSSR